MCPFLSLKLSVSLSASWINYKIWKRYTRQSVKVNETFLRVFNLTAANLIKFFEHFAKFMCLFLSLKDFTFCIVDNLQNFEKVHTPICKSEWNLPFNCRKSHVFFWCEEGRELSQIKTVGNCKMRYSPSLVFLGKTDASHIYAGRLMDCKIFFAKFVRKIWSGLLLFF